MNGFELEPVTLTGRYVTLEPLTAAHVPELWDVADFADIWRFMPFQPDSESGVQALVEGALGLADAGQMLAFVQRSNADGRVVGSTSYLNPDPTHRRVEIGATWLTPAAQRTGINTEAKYLLLEHAFEHLDCIRVEFKTDARNSASRAALERIGATEEGTLRHHMIMPDGHLRDSTYFSILRTEWPEVRASLEGLMSRA
jgi:RimJ/RimL family protein N-acetyltransferase